ncbi:hypothetical protein GGR57DRAFT_515254 [Xylariaceae sp. FL1272]|nr:hypothetical protein GGR57DRAFT_515254 [Xylariaceae sp. FL1272]
MESMSQPATDVKNPGGATAIQASADGNHVNTNMRPQVFHLYPKLPMELKAMVWEFAFLELFPGAQCFKLSTKLPDVRMISVKPDNDRKGDPSAWRQVNYLLGACDIADFFQTRLVKRGLTLYHDSRGLHRVNTEENGIKANVSGQDDLIRFKFYYGDSHASLSMVESINHQPAFNGITRVGVDLEQLRCFPGLSKQPTYRPFRCLCQALGQAGNHIQLGPTEYLRPNFICCAAIIRFASLFRDLKSFYIIVNLKDKNLEYTELRIPASKKLHKVNNNGVGTQLALNIFVHHHEIAKSEGRDIFHDRRGTYCQIDTTHPDDEDAPVGLGWGENLQIYATLKKLRTMWPRKQQRPAVQFKALGFCDLRNAEKSNGERSHFSEWR